MLYILSKGGEEYVATKYQPAKTESQVDSSS